MILPPFLCIRCTEAVSSVHQTAKHSAELQSLRERVQRCGVPRVHWQYGCYPHPSWTSFMWNQTGASWIQDVLYLHRKDLQFNCEPPPTDSLLNNRSPGKVEWQNSDPLRFLHVRTAKGCFELNNVVWTEEATFCYCWRRSRTASNNDNQGSVCNCG